jgi:ribosomal protein S18 acetylase RimI-like enzyme
MREQIIRPADSEDAPAVADVWLRSRRTAAIPRAVHTDAEVGVWVRDVLIPSCEVWVATDGGEVVGLMALAGDWVEQLYIAPEHQCRGHGARLLAIAQANRTALVLWTFESNVAAQRFYEAHGFIRLGESSTDNEECAPAIRFGWSAPRAA